LKSCQETVQYVHIPLTVMASVHISMGTEYIL